MSRFEKYKQEIKTLRNEGFDMLEAFMKSEGSGAKTKNYFVLEDKYQGWYTKAFAVVRQVLPNRLADFEELYKPSKNRKEINRSNYTIQDLLIGTRSAKNHNGEKYFADSDIVTRRILSQVKIVEAARDRLQSSLFDIKQTVQADLFDHELDAARHLLKNGHDRAAGSIAGVVLEGHLAQVCENHLVKIHKKDPSISDFNDALKNAGVIDVPEWRRIQRLGDIRNLSDHKKERPPTSEEVLELIDGVEKTIKNLR